MAEQSITHYVNVSVSLASTGPAAAGFGNLMFLYEHALEAARLAGPFTTPDAVLDAGHASGSPPHKFAQAVVAQQPRISQFYIGRADSGDASLGASYDAVVADNPGAFYCTAADSRDSADLLSLSAAINGSAFPKIGILQSSEASILSGEGPAYTATIGGTPADGNYDLIFTGFGLVSPVTVRVARSTTPATNDDLAAAIEAALFTEASSGGNLDGVVDPASVGSASSVVSFKIVDGLATGTVTTAAPSGATITVALVDADLATRLFDLGYLRTALIYHPTDADRLDAGWASRCLSFNLDQRKGIWAYKKILGQTGTSLTDAQVAAIRAVNCNYFSPAVMSSGVVQSAFTAQGWVSGGNAGAGRRIDVITTLDYLKARMEEALVGVLLRETHGVPYTDAGINRFAAAVRGVLSRAVAAGHLVVFQVPEGEPREGLNTPAVIVPKLSETTTTERETRTLTFSVICYLASFIEKVVFSVEVRQ